MRHRSFVTIGAAALAASALAAAPMVGSYPVRAADVLLDAPFGLVLEACNRHCDACALPNGKNGHEVIEPDSLNEANVWSAHPESCQVGSCDDHDCDDGGVITGGGGQPDLWLAVRGASGEALADLIRAHPGIVAYNRDRGAIQLFCLEGAVIASAPLAAQQDAALRLALSTATLSER